MDTKKRPPHYVRAVSSLSSTGRVGSLLGVALLAFVAGYLGGVVRDVSESRA
jgi:hypothetical protein